MNQSPVLPLTDAEIAAITEELVPQFNAALEESRKGLDEMRAQFADGPRDEFTALFESLVKMFEGFEAAAQIINSLLATIDNLKAKPAPTWDKERLAKCIKDAAVAYRNLGTSEQIHGSAYYIADALIAASFPAPAASPPSAALWDAADAYLRGVDDAAALFEQVNPASDSERLRGDPGADAMGSVLEYRDKIRALISLETFDAGVRKALSKLRPTAEPTAETGEK